MGVDLGDPAEVQAYIARLPSTVRSLVGGNTTCVEIDAGGTTIIIDCGSGMRALGLSLMSREFGLGMGTAHILFTHAHWDHLQGYPFFAPAYVPGNRLIFYAVGRNPREYLEHQQVAPTYFPIPPDAMLAEKEFIQLREGQPLQIGRTEVTHLELYHPGNAYAYRFDDGESVFVFASDGEYKSLDADSLEPYTQFFSEADALAFDSQYSLRDVFLSKADWGHSSAIIGVDIAERARVKKLITLHHDPTHSDEQIQEIADAAIGYARVNDIPGNTEVIVAREGMELYLGKPLGFEHLTDRGNGAWMMAMAGRLDRSTAQEAGDRLSEFLAEANPRPVLLDLNLVALLDAVGVKAILDTIRQSSSTDLAFIADTPHIRRTLRLSEVESVAPLLRTRRQALALLTGPGRRLKESPAIAGEYMLGDILTVDELGVVYRAQNRTADHRLIVHIVGGGEEHPERVEFERLAAGWVGLHHPLVLPGRRLIREKGWVGYVGDWVEGQSFRGWARSGPAFEQTLRSAAAVAEALAHLHANGVLHGDLHPENIVVHDGLPRLSHSPLFVNHDHPTSGAYHAPEQLRGLPPSARGDVYGLGIVVYELLLGGHPFAADSEELMITLKLRSEPQSPRLRWPAIPDRLDAFLIKLLATDPQHRYPSAVEAHAEFQALIPEVLSVASSQYPVVSSR